MSERPRNECGEMVFGKLKELQGRHLLTSTDVAFHNHQKQHVYFL